jgi:hypothetical protein
MIVNSLRAAAGSVALVAVAAATFLVYPDTEATCAAGTRMVEHGDRVACRRERRPERADELLEANDHRYRKAGVVPEGALRAAIERRDAMKSLKASVPGAGGHWTEYGAGNLDDGFGVFQGARIDNFAYDPEHKRLFAAVGSGGIWMTEAVNGDVRTLADHWVSVGDRLPSLVNSGVAWTPSGGGTLIAAGGESVMGSSGYLGLGAHWTNDLGASWHHASGVPDGAMVFRAAVDPSNPDIVYVASSKGLFRSSDAGRSYLNVALPTTDECAGVETLGPCQFTNYVTDVAIRHPGGSTGATCEPAGCPVLAAVGFRTGPLPFQDGRPMAPANGLYRSDTGQFGSFTKLDVSAADTNSPLGFTVQNRIARTALGQAVGDDQDHNYIYAMVQDAQLFNGGGPFADNLDGIMAQLPLPFPSMFNGLYVSPDFGSTWTRMADTAEVLTAATGSEIAVIGPVSGSGPGAQAWYNLWVAIDPTRALAGVPTRLTFGLEEVWQNRVTSVPLNGIAQAGPSDFNVIGVYNGLLADPSTGLPYPSTTHPDQHGAIYVPTGDGGVCLFLGNDGGSFKQCVDSGAEMGQAGWGFGANTGIYALLPYGVGVAKDGTVWFGLQDNGSGHIEPADRSIHEDFGSDGFYAEVDPDNSGVAYTESQNGGLIRTTDRGASSTGIAPTYTKVQFDNWFRMDPLDAQHMVTAAQEIYETAHAQTVTAGSWVQVFNLGTNPDTGAVRTTTTIEVLGDAVYVGGCGDCGVSGNDAGFANVIATNVGGAAAPQRETGSGWHFAAAAGLPNRYITSFAIDPANPRVIYATLAGYLSNLRPPGSYIDPNQNIGSGNVFKSTDAGESFSNISGNLPNVEANSVVLRGSQLVLGTDIGAFISTDTSGALWAPLGDGIPNVPVNMLRLQPAHPEMLFAATFGRGVWNYEFKDGAVVNPPVPTTDVADKGRFGGALPVSLLGVMLLAALRRRRNR